MRKHDVRKWIHAVLDMLPLFIIPIFAIYMHRHNVTNYEVETSGYEITEKFTTNEVSSIDDLVVGNIYHFDYISFSFVDNAPFGEFDVSLYSIGSFYSNHGYSSVFIDNYLDFDDYDSNSNNFVGIYYYYFSDEDYGVNYTYIGNENINLIGAYSLEYDADFIYFENVDLTFESDYFIDYYEYFLTHIDLNSQYFSLPSISSFQSYDYQYNEGLTYNDTDIGSQFIYALYLPIEKYFNFNNVATFNNMYQWLTTNFFNGQVPLVVPIVWNIILYEFIMDVLFLIYALFMFIIDFVECLIDKAFGKSYRGGR